MGGWVGGFFLFVRVFICLFIVCLFVRYFLQTLDPTGFESLRG